MLKLVASPSSFLLSFRLARKNNKAMDAVLAIHNGSEQSSVPSFNQSLSKELGIKSVGQQTNERSRVRKRSEQANE